MEVVAFDTKLGLWSVSVAALFIWDSCLARPCTRQDYSFMLESTWGGGGVKLN